MFPEIQKSWKGWKVTLTILGMATFFLLWAALNLWTGRAYYPGTDSRGSDPGRFVTRGEDEQFWSVIVLKLTAGGLLLIILGHLHWKRWRRGVKEKGQSESVVRSIDT